MDGPRALLLSVERAAAQLTRDAWAAPLPATLTGRLAGRSGDGRCGILGDVNPNESPLDPSSPTLILFCGLPGSGKSTLARRLETEGRGVRLSADEWQAALGIGHVETDFHEQLQGVLYHHALALLRRGVDVILEDGLWTTGERKEKFADARSCSARIELHVFDVDYDTLRERLRRRNDQAEAADYPMTEHELRSVWDIFQPISSGELAEVDSSAMHTGGLD